MKGIIFLLTVVFLTGCDAVNRLFYVVENKTDSTVQLHVPDFPYEPEKGSFSSVTDTIIELLPNQKVWVGASLTDIDFPWATKNIYKNYPGICGLERIQNDTLVPLDCTKSAWKYTRKTSVLKIK